MKATLAVLATLALVAAPVWAGTVVKSDTFTFNASSMITSWDGSDPANPPYPDDMGAVSLQSPFGGGHGSGIEVPWQLGYLNNGYLSPCDPIAWGQATYTIGDGTHTGDAFSVSGSTTCPGFTGEYGSYENSNNRLEGFSVTANYTVVKHTSCYRGRCVSYFASVLAGGTGTITDSTIN
jgi:hypothetical protein